MRTAERYADGRRRVVAGVETIRQAQRSFRINRGKRLSAGLAYYSIFAIVPTIFSTVAVAGLLVGQEAAEGRLVDRLDRVLGVTTAEQIQAAVVALDESTDSSRFALISAGAVVYSASVLFVAWRDTLELMWGVPYEPGFTTTLRTRAFGVLVPLGAGLVLSAIIFLELLVSFAEQLASSEVLDGILRLAGSTVPTAAAVIALGLLYRHTARTRHPEWAEVWPGTILVSVALAVCSWGYGLYVRLIGSSSVAGAASTVLVGLVFVYYSAQILVFGAEVINATRERRMLRPTEETHGST